MCRLHPWLAFVFAIHVLSLTYSSVRGAARDVTDAGSALQQASLLRDAQTSSEPDPGVQTEDKSELGLPYHQDETSFKGSQGIDESAGTVPPHSQATEYLTDFSRNDSLALLMHPVPCHFSTGPGASTNSRQTRYLCRRSRLAGSPRYSSQPRVWRIPTRRTWQANQRMPNWILMKDLWSPSVGPRHPFVGRNFDWIHGINEGPVTTPSFRNMLNSRLGFGRHFGPAVGQWPGGQWGRTRAPIPRRGATPNFVLILPRLPWFVPPVRPTPSGGHGRSAHEPAERGNDDAYSASSSSEEADTEVPVEPSPETLSCSNLLGEAELPSDANERMKLLKQVLGEMRTTLNQLAFRQGQRHATSRDSEDDEEHGTSNTDDLLRRLMEWANQAACLAETAHVLGAPSEGEMSEKLPKGEVSKDSEYNQGVSERATSTNQTPATQTQENDLDITTEAGDTEDETGSTILDKIHNPSTAATEKENPSTVTTNENESTSTIMATDESQGLTELAQTTTGSPLWVEMETSEPKSQMEESPSESTTDGPEYTSSGQSGGKEAEKNASKDMRELDPEDTQDPEDVIHEQAILGKEVDDADMLPESTGVEWLPEDKMDFHDDESIEAPESLRPVPDVEKEEGMEPDEKHHSSFEESDKLADVKVNQFLPIRIPVRLDRDLLVKDLPEDPSDIITFSKGSS